MEANECCEKLGLLKPVVKQCEYSMLRRSNMEILLPFIFDKCGSGATIWSPLCGGILTGKYNEGVKPAEGRYASKLQGGNFADFLFGGFMGKTEEDVKNVCQKLKALGEVAEGIGCTQGNLALAWCLVNKDVTVALVGATKLVQMEDNLKALEVAGKWTEDLELKIAV